MNKYTSVLVLLLIAALLSGCSKPSPNADETSDAAEAVSQADISVASISAAIEAELSDASLLTAVDADYITTMSDLDLTAIEDFVLKVQTSGTSVTSFGVFKAAANADPSALKASIQAYLDTLEANWELFDYLPAELPKLKAAQAIEKGGFVMFAIASDSERKAAESAFHALTDA